MKTRAKRVKCFDILSFSTLNFKRSFKLKLGMWCLQFVWKKEINANNFLWQRNTNPKWLLSKTIIFLKMSFLEILNSVIRIWFKINFFRMGRYLHTFLVRFIIVSENCFKIDLYSATHHKGTKELGAA